MLPAVPAAAQEACSRSVIFTLPAVTWDLVQRHEPPNLLALSEEGALGSVAVRTNSSRTSYASGYATIGAGTRTDGGASGGGIAETGAEVVVAGGARLMSDVEPSGVAEILEIAVDANYHAVPGALASALDDPLIAIGNGDAGIEPPSPGGLGKWSLLAAMDEQGVVELAAVGDDLLGPSPGAPYGVRTDRAAVASAVDAGFDVPCASMVIQHGDLTRVDRYGAEVGRPSEEDLRKALLAADELLGHVAEGLTPDDLLLVVAPTSPFWDDDVHLGVAVAWGPGFPAGSSLVSASTRQDGIVTLPDVAPTVLAHLGIGRPDVMIGRPWVAISDGPGRVSAAVDLDRESVFSHGLQAAISTGFVVIQIVIYLAAFFFLRRRERSSEGLREGPLDDWLGRAVLAIVGFPLATYLASPLTAHELGAAGYISALVVIDLVIVALATVVLKAPLMRLLAITAGTAGLFIVEQLLGGVLQLNAVWGNDPIVAGRFTGLGNIAFAVLGTASLMTGAVLVHHWPRRGVFALVGALYVVTVVIDGAPTFGSDVGGVLALVPALGITWVLLLGRKPTLRLLAGVAVAALVALGGFLLLDLARPPESRTHLGRLFDDVTARGGGVFLDTIDRKISTNLRVFRSTIWTYLVPPAVGVIAWLLLRPTGRWRRLAIAYPRLRAGLIGGVLLGVLGFAVNDSGIVVPAMVLSFLVPMSLLIHLTLEREEEQGAGAPVAG
jgi:hypothetical protein